MTRIDVTKDQLGELTELAQDAQNASVGDSNDAEIEALRDALDFALGLLGLRLPEPIEDD